MQDLGTLGGLTSSACDINELGQVVGRANDPSGANLAFLWQDGLMQNLGTLGREDSGAEAINALGQVVGYSVTPSEQPHGFLWLPAPAFGMPAGMHDLDTPGLSSFAYDINMSGQVVGRWYTSPSSEDSHAFLWENGAVYDLNMLVSDGSGWLLNVATGVNDLGQIVGAGTYGGKTRAYLLTPVPEPSMLGAVGVALLVVMRRLRRG
jgi:probable HAF family extracellular repeat protein